MSSSTCISSSNSNIKPVSETRFSRPVDTDGCGGGGGGVRVVDSKSCRQMYLRTAYTFSRREDQTDNGMEKAKKCLSKVKDRVNLVYKRDHDKSFRIMRNNNKSMVIFSKVKEFSCASFLSMIRRMLACTAKVDVAEH
ncbi:uncharacterized protein LOC104900461 [Beta vulgaris subsp. vulgaris]|uniref:uncharacterized protein LOC104900461 n=1 Tax=Beta vulgaris subsp. vulgaris TaxID=3555 RepID=UPI0020367133|nr:uncharacterized protein LOC104900461 [Beta vulgaris subsp. vulgaris]